jgi:nitrate reductase gamma subunit
MNLEFARGPLFQFALIVFIVGMTYRFLRIIFLGWKKDYAPAKGSAAAGVVKTYAKALIILPFLPPKFPGTRHRPLTYIAGGMFHLGLLIVVFFGAAHVEAWRSIVGFGWPSLPTPIVDGFAAMALIGMVILVSYRMVSPVGKMLTGVGDWLNWIVVFIPLLTGWAAFHHLFGVNYTKLFTLHMVTVDILLIWIPFSRISHFMTYFITRTMHGIKFGRLGVEP